MRELQNIVEIGFYKVQDIVLDEHRERPMHSSSSRFFCILKCNKKLEISGNKGGRNKSERRSLKKASLANEEDSVHWFVDVVV